MTADADPLRAFAEAYLAQARSESARTQGDAPRIPDADGETWPDGAGEGHEAPDRLPLAAFLARFPAARALLTEAVLSAELDGDPLGDLHGGLDDDRAGTGEPPDAGGRRVGPYRLVRELGRGGQAAVWLAEDVRLGRKVALKVLETASLFASSEALRRFQAEAHTASRLDHPGICAVFEAGEADGVAFIAMRLIEGRTLAAHIAAARTTAETSGRPYALALPPAQAEDGDASTATPARLAVASVLRCIEEAARALHAAHQVGIVHRDVKPGNIMVQLDGSPVLLDFGLARDDESAAPTLTRTGDRFGTPAYMSPEQVRGVARLDWRTDVYSLGITLFEALTGVKPFDAPTYEGVHRQILNGRLPDPCRLRRALPREARVVIATAADLDPNRRYQSALEFAEDLARIQRHEPIRAEPASAVLRARRWVQRNPVLTAFLAVVGASAVAMALLFATAQANLDRFERLSDARLLARLDQEEQDVWPAWPENAPRMQRWLDEARSLAARLPDHRARLAQLREAAFPYEESDRVRDEQAHPEGATLRMLRARRDVLPAEASARGALDDKIAALEARIAAERSWRFVSASDQVLHDTLALLVRGLEAFVDPARGKIAVIEQGLGWARRVAAQTIGEHEAMWRRAADEIARDPRFSGLMLHPQVGLVPLGPDPGSGLWEFAHTASGRVPQRDDQGKLASGSETCIVFVLVPGGPFRMGCLKANKGERGPYQDEYVRPIELHLVDVQLEPFFIAKHEVTQHQWAELTGGERPSTYAGTTRFGVVTPRHPVETVSQERCARVLARHGLVLPTEAQWERAARAGTETIWWFGDDPGSIEHFENVYDKGAEDVGFRGLEPEPDPDGHVIHAPVGAYAPNGFGLYDVHGNVSEWCRDVGAAHANEPHRLGDGLLLADATSGDRHALRGGNFGFNASWARSAYRQIPNGSDNYWGLRAARPILR